MRSPRIAVLSLESMCGKSSFISIVSGIYSRSHGRRVSIVSTGDITDNKEIVSIDYHNDDLSNPHVIKVILENGLDNPEDILNYGAKQGREDVYIFDLLSTTVNENDQEEYFKDSLKMIPSDLMFVEIHGNPLSELNRTVISACDAAIILFKPSPSSIRKINAFKKEMEEAFRNVAFTTCCNEFDSYAITEKNLDKKIMANPSCLKMPYSPSIRKACLDGSLDRLCYDIIAGEGPVLPIRIRVYEILCWMLNDNRVNVVKEVAKWSR